MRKLSQRVAVATIAIGFAAASTTLFGADDRASVVGQYVETRTAEVFTGGCIMNSEGETGGREALMAWRIDRGALDGVALDGLAVVAAVTADVNLGTRELGGIAPRTIRSVLYVDARAGEGQRQALVDLASTLSNGFIGEVVAVRPVKIDFSSDEETIRVKAGDAAMSVGRHMQHDVSCSAMQWFKPLGSVLQPTLGVTRRQAFSGDLLGRRWEQIDRRSAFFGSFRY
jgi:hypothetical protein